MEDPECEARALAEVVESLPQAVQERLLGLSSLSDREAAIIRDRMREGSPAVDGLARNLLGHWHALTLQERVASLLAIAAALQRSG